jgi:hypothetical protein
MNTNEANQRLKRLVESTSFKELGKKVAMDVNIFDILRVSDMEIRHSNMLAWLLDPSKNHGFGDFILKELYEEISGKSSRGVKYDSFKVLREWHNIDLLLVSNESKIVICIENKVHASESRYQLKKYREIVDGAYSNDYKKFFVFLTLDGEEASEANKDIWGSLSYEFIIDLLRRGLKIHELYPKSEIIIKQYLKVLERNVMGVEDEIQKLCDKVYGENEEVLELIYKHTRKDPAQIARDNVKEWLSKANIEPLYLDEGKSSRSFFRFRSKFLDSIIPQDEDGTGGSWRNGIRYYYEIAVYQNGYASIYLGISPKNAPTKVRENLRMLFEEGQKLKKYKREHTFDADKNWMLALKFTKSLPFADENELPENVGKFKKVFMEDIPAFEDSLKKLFS